MSTRQGCFRKWKPGKPVIAGNKIFAEAGNRGGTAFFQESPLIHSITVERIRGFFREKSSARCVKKREISMKYFFSRVKREKGSMADNKTRTMIAQSVSVVGEQVLLEGWVDSKRDHGKVTFVDLRDKSGTVQCVGYKMLGDVTPESVLRIHGIVKARPENMINDSVPTGSIEIEVQDYEILNLAKELPIPVAGDGRSISEEVRLKYRYLDLRRERMRKNLQLRSKFIHAFRQSLASRDFTEVETPMLTKSTKEGSRDFIVPSRFQPGKFYALPQSPQQYKQLLMTAGVERYFQFARCVRDEDLRADRGFEHTQIDMELSFVNRDSIMAIFEEMLIESVTAVGGKLKDVEFPVYTYQEAIEQFGADKFDIRTEDEKEHGVLAFAWVVDFPFFKKVDTDDAAEVADGKSGWTFTHNPFSMPKPEHLEQHLAGENVGDILTTQYDLVCNGYEVGGGSIRAHRPEILEATYKIMGYSDEQIRAGVGHMLDAFKVGTPPHGGIGWGLDRLVMVLANEISLKEVVPFPMSSTGRTAVMDAPNEVDPGLLEELHLRVVGQTNPHEAILTALKTAGVDYQYYAHEPVFTSEEAAAVRGTNISQAAKALVAQADKKYALIVLPGDKRADLDAIATKIGAKRLKMASKESVKSHTGLEVGSIPPFGSVMGMQTYVDPDLAANKEIAFNVGRHDRSVKMAYAALLSVEQPIVLD